MDAVGRLRSSRRANKTSTRLRELESELASTRAQVQRLTEYIATVEAARQGHARASMLEEVLGGLRSRAASLPPVQFTTEELTAIASDD